MPMPCLMSRILRMHRLPTAGTKSRSSNSISVQSYSGHIDYAGEPYNLSTYINPHQYILKNLEYGAGVYFTWIYEPNYKLKDTEYHHLYAVHYKEWIDLAQEMYEEINAVLKDVHRRTDHRTQQVG